MIPGTTGAIATQAGTPASASRFTAASRLRAAGALGCFYLPVRRPFEVAPLFRAWLDEHFPDRAGKVMHIIQSIRGGKDNDPNWFSRMRGQGPWADLLKTRFERAVKKHGLNVDKRPLRRDLFEPPRGAQLRLF